MIQGGYHSGWFKSDKESNEARTGVEERREQLVGTRNVIKERKKDLDKVNIKQGPAKEVLAKHGLHLTREHFRSLAVRNNLNDKIIEEYLRFVSVRNKENFQLPSVHVCQVFLFKQLSKYVLRRRVQNNKILGP